MITFRKIPEFCPRCKQNRLVRQRRGVLLRVLPRSEQYMCLYCETKVLRLFSPRNPEMGNS